MARTADECKQLSIREFTKAAKVYESGHAGIYEMCKDDYPQMLAELERRPFADVLDEGAEQARSLSCCMKNTPDAHYTFRPRPDARHDCRCAGVLLQTDESSLSATRRICPSPANSF